jgi:hypothetical protein
MNKVYNYYIYVAYILLIGSIGSNIANIKIFEDLSLKNLLELRSLFPLIILLINLIILTHQFKLNFLNYSRHILLFFFWVTLIQIISLIINRYDFFLLQFILGTLSIVSLFTMIFNNNSEKILSKLLSITFFLIFFLIIIFIYQNPNLSYGGGWLSVFGYKIINLNSNGFSRYLLFLYIFIYTNQTLSNNLNFFKFLILLAISTLIFLYEGRLNIGCLLIVNLVIFLRKTNFFKKILLFIFVSIIPFIFSIALQNHYKNNLDLSNFSENRDLLNFSENRFSKTTSNLKNINHITTGRVEKWKVILNHKQSTIKVIIGNGPEFDRYLLEKNFGNKIGSDSANVILYFYLCGGLLSLILLLLLIIKQFHKMCEDFIRNDFYTYKSNHEVFVSAVCLMYLLIRSLFENSFGVWSIDQIFFILFACYLNFFLKKNNKLKN